MTSKYPPSAAPHPQKVSEVETQGLDQEIRISSTALDVRGALQQLESTLLECSAPDDLCERIEQVMAEVLNNVVEHAYSNHSDGEITILFCYRNNLFRTVILDNGQPMPNETIPSAQFPDLTGPKSALPEGGFGWLMIHSIASVIKYTKTQTGNRTYLEIPI